MVPVAGNLLSLFSKTAEVVPAPLFNSNCSYVEVPLASLKATVNMSAESQVRFKPLPSTVKAERVSAPMPTLIVTVRVCAAGITGSSLLLQAVKAAMQAIPSKRFLVFILFPPDTCFIIVFLVWKTPQSWD